MGLVGRPVDLAYAYIRAEKYRKGMVGQHKTGQETQQTATWVGESIELERRDEACGSHRFALPLE
jgi:hypothetical protein